MGSGKRRASRKLAWIGAVLFALLTSTLALQYANAETKGAAPLPASPDFKNGSFGNPPVSVARFPVMPTGWTAWVPGGEGPFVTHGINSPSDGYQTAAVRSGGIMQKFNTGGKVLQYSFDARSGVGGMPTKLTYVAGMEHSDSETAEVLKVQLPAGVKYAGSAKVGRVQGSNVNLADVTAKVNGKILMIPIGSTPGESGGEIGLGERYRVEYEVQVDKVSEVPNAHNMVLPSNLVVRGGTVWLSSSLLMTPRADVGFDGGGFTNENGYQVGDKADVDVVVKNSGPDDAQNAVVNVDKPAGLQDFKPTVPLPQGVTCGEMGGTYECKLGSLANGDSRKLTFSGEVKNSGTLEVEANVTSSTINLKGRVISTSYSTNSSNRIDLGVKAEIQNDDGTSLPAGSVVKPDDKLKLVVKADNAGPARTQNFRVDLPLPAGVKLDEDVNGYDKEAGVWSVGLMEPRKDATLTLPVTVLADEKKVALRAEVDPESYKNLEEFELGNNISQTSVDIARSATLTVLPSSRRST
ncbi:hypothetical protein ACTVZO_33520 [Streptomyces sp. IBSNAI002]